MAHLQPLNQGSNKLFPAQQQPASSASANPDLRTESSTTFYYDLPDPDSPRHSLNIDQYGVDYESVYEEAYLNDADMEAYYPNTIQRQNRVGGAAATLLRAGANRIGGGGGNGNRQGGGGGFDSQDEGDDGDFGWDEEQQFTETLNRHKKVFSTQKEFLSANVKTFAIYNPPPASSTDPFSTSNNNNNNDLKENGTEVQNNALISLARNPAAWGAVDALLLPLPHLTKSAVQAASAYLDANNNPPSPHPTNDDRDMRSKSFFGKVKQNLTRAMSTASLSSTGTAATQNQNHQHHHHQPQMQRSQSSMGSEYISNAQSLANRSNSTPTAAFMSNKPRTGSNPVFPVHGNQHSPRMGPTTSSPHLEYNAHQHQQQHYNLPSNDSYTPATGADFSPLPPPHMDRSTPTGLGVTYPNVVTTGPHPPPSASAASVLMMMGGRGRSQSSGPAPNHVTSPTSTVGSVHDLNLNMGRPATSVGFSQATMMQQLQQMQQQTGSVFGDYGLRRRSNSARSSFSQSEYGMVSTQKERKKERKRKKPPRASLFSHDVFFLFLFDSIIYSLSLF
jgi:hypothetical protein